VEAKVEELSFPLSDVTISATTEIPLHEEQWFKSMLLDMVNYKYFLKPRHKNKEYGAIVLREYLLEPYRKLLKVIQRYFTCEGIFGRVYQYHFRLFMHFTGKSPLNLPFYLFRSISKMEDKVQGKNIQVEPNLFHLSLIKLLVVEEMRKRKQSWQAFLDSSKLTSELLDSSWSKNDTPSLMAKDFQPTIERLVKNSQTSVHQYDKKKGKKLHFSPKVVEVSKKPYTRVAAKRLHMEKIPKHPTKVQDTIS